MKNSTDNAMVMAYGDNGLEPTPADQVAYVQVLPLAPGNRPVPATLRSLRFQPRRLVGIRRSGSEWPLLRMRDADGRLMSCYVRNASEASDALFATLPAKSRARIEAAAVKP